MLAERTKDGDRAATRQYWKGKQVRTRILFDFNYLVDSQQIFSYVHNVQGRDQDDDQNEEEAGANTLATMSIERQRFGG